MNFQFITATFSTQNPKFGGTAGAFRHDHCQAQPANTQLVGAAGAFLTIRKRYRQMRMLHFIKHIALFFKDRYPHLKNKYIDYKLIFF